MMSPPDVPHLRRSIWSRQPFPALTGRAKLFRASGACSRDLGLSTAKNLTFFRRIVSETDE